MRFGWIGMVVILVIGMGVKTAEADEPTRLEEVIVTASKAKTPAKRVTRSVSVIPSEELSVVQGGFAMQALSDVPETLVRRSGSIGRTTAVVVRGASAPQIHVTLDGAHVASPTLGSFDFNHFTPDNLERIEVLRGPGSVLYGSDAMGGVIHLITRRGEGPMKYSYTQEVGQQNTFREVAALKGAVGKWHLSGSASRMDSSGLSQNDDYQNLTLSTRVGYDLSDKTTLDLSVRHLFAIVGIDDGAFRPDPNRKDKERDTFVTGKLETETAPWWSQLFRLSTSLGNLIDSDPSNGGTEADTLSKLGTERYGAEWMNRFTPVKWDTVTLGVEFEDREADRRTAGADQNFSKAQTTQAGYLQNEWRPIDPLTLVAGLRLFRESSFGAGQVADASIAYFIAPWNLKLRGGWGQGFRAPSLNELFFPNFGNPTLAAEKSMTFEGGMDQVLFDGKVGWSGSLFRTDYKDLIQIVRISSTSSEPQNVGRSRIDGVEGDLEFKPWKPWTLTGSYTHLEANERPSGEELLRIPKNTVGLRVGFAPSPRWDLGLKGLLVSSREESTGTNSRNKTKGYLKFDLLGQYRFTSWIKAYLRIENLTDRHYSEVLGFPANDFLATVGVTVER
ncbi:MAG: TonB-dependent receptor [Candidatus Omnitrophica bacterium]|nr:TonB-dependent receptor [Candidatus Omnitrophota bacterium]